MEYAELEIRPGYRKTVSAYEVSNGKYRKSGNYFCPSCKEPVTPRTDGSYKRPHFAHERYASEIAQECPDFHSIAQINNNYYNSSKFERGLPYYINKIGDKFELYLGIPKISANILNECGSDENIRIHSEDWVEIIKISDIKPDCIYLQPINEIFESYIIDYSKNYQINEIFDCGKLVNSGIMISGIVEGMFFHVRSSSSSKIAFKGKLYIKTEYYYLTRKTTILPSFITIIGESVPLITIDDDWCVYTIVINEYSRQAEFFVSKHNLILWEKPGELIVLWPPTIQEYYTETNKYDSNYNGKVITNILSKNEAIYGVIKSPQKRDNELILIDGCNNSDYKKKIDNYDNVAETKFKYREGLSHEYHTPKINVLLNENEIQNNSIDLKRPKNKSIVVVNNNMKCTILQSNNGLPKLLWNGNPSLKTIINIQAGDNFLILHGLDKIFEFSFLKSNTNHQKSIISTSDDEIIKYLEKLRKDYVPFTSKIKYIAPMFMQYPKTKAYILKSMHQGVIPKKAEEYLLNKILHEGF